MRDLNLNHWLMLHTNKNSAKEITLGFIYLAVIFSISYICASLIN